MKSDNIFIPGEVWLYMQLYCGQLSVDTILVNKFYPLLKQMENRKVIEKWFFIKYTSPSNHIRLRVKFFDKKSFHEVQMKLNKKIKILLKQNVVWDVTLNTYKRELNRYSYVQYDLTEDLFHLDSKLFLENIDLLNSENLKLFYAMKSALDIIKIYYKNPNDVLSFIKHMEINYKSEFNIKKETNKILGIKYRNLKKSISQVFDEKDKEFLAIRKLLVKRNNIVEELLFNQKKQKKYKFKFVSSHIHMNINRTFSHNQRLFETIIYDFLFRYYNSHLKIAKN